jgi:hypothetical protein
MSPPSLFVRAPQVSLDGIAQPVGQSFFVLTAYQL